MQIHRPLFSLFPLSCRLGLVTGLLYSFLTGVCYMVAATFLRDADSVLEERRDSAVRISKTAVG